MPNRIRRFSLKSSLLALVLLCVTPPTVMSLWLMWGNYQLLQERAEEKTLQMAREIAADFESELNAIEAALKVLSVAPELMEEDMAGFQVRAKQALVAGTVYNYILTDRQGLMIMNTLVPYGQPLPKTGTPPQLDAVFTTGNTVLTDMFIGPVTQKPALAMGVPVRIRGDVKYSLNIGLSPDRLNAKLRELQLPEGWLVAILDETGTIIGRSRDAQRYVGQPGVAPLRDAIQSRKEAQLRIPTKEGIPTFAGLIRMNKWHWGVVVGMHESTLNAQFRPQAYTVATLTSVILVLSLVGAFQLGRRVLNTVRSINQSAQSLQTGETLVLPQVQFREAEAVSSALQKAAQAMQQVTYQAQHDVLTGLANRLLFSENAQRQLSLARRQGHGLAILAIDMDHFKAVNDTQGHAVGDEVLVEAAQRLKQSLRQSDMVARLGGDEFMVLLVDTDTQHAEQSATRIVQALSQPYPQTSVPVSGSVGMALFPTHGQSLEGLMKAADQALYAAKASGRQCVLTATTA